MCGIAGIYNATKVSEVSSSTMEEMLSTLMHRGPDGWGTYRTDQLFLGHVRLSIVDIEGGHQPMLSERYAISYNGEIFNYIELREELEQKGVRFQTTCDTEVVIKSFEVYGTGALSRFNGQFSLLLWDRLEKKLLVARDRLGIRPLYILQLGRTFYFASEVKAFDAIQGYQRRFDQHNLFEHALLWNTLNDATVYEGVRSLPAGCYEVYEADTLPTTFRYYEIGESAPPVGTPSLEQAIGEFKELLQDSITLRLRSDVPVATYLSGGIDSSVITHLTSRIKADKFKTFSVAFSDNDFDESSFQQEMVEHLNSEHSEVRVNYEMINNTLLDAVYHLERPIFRTAPVPLFLLSEEVNRQGIKVVLTGEGADEILFGYDSFKELKLLDFWRKQSESKLRPLLIKRLYPHLQHYTDSRQFGMMRMYYEGFLPNITNEMASLNIRVNNNKAIVNFFNKDFKLSFDHQGLLDKIRQTIPDNFSSWSLLQRNQFLEMKSLLSGYLLSSQGDRMSMAHSVEGRYPFLDHRLIEKVFHYPDSYKMKVLKQKYLLTKTFEKNIPPSIVNRPKRPYMSPDLKSFFVNGELTETAEFFLSDLTVDNFGIFDKKYVGRLINKFKKKIPENIGYRDNMIITFLLSTQMCCYWARNPKEKKLDYSLKTTDIIDC
ncbi:asparagine synthase (glutamine-hydrolyzing) [Myxococcota bacterium]|nr:asparagine synthase (glutamine-hydrolyzing) [Myxococcota bacterium]MBU1381834.1 asparagine synthase (glutamine-hydrolyzing) [Myxococcota bacterium]